MLAQIANRCRGPTDQQISAQEEESKTPNLQAQRTQSSYMVLEDQLTLYTVQRLLQASTDKSRKERKEQTMILSLATEHTFRNLEKILKSESNLKNDVEYIFGKINEHRPDNALMRNLIEQNRQYESNFKNRVNERDQEEKGKIRWRKKPSKEEAPKHYSS